MAIDTLITDVAGIVYFVSERDDNIMYVQCEYDADNDAARFDPHLCKWLITKETLTPLAQHEPQIRKLIYLMQENRRFPSREFLETHGENFN